MKRNSVVFGTVSSVALLAASMFSTSVSAEDVAAGQTLYQNVCLSCHGAQGAGQAIFPSVQGQSVDYLTGKLELYRSGETVGQHTALMAPHARSLSDEDIANVAAYMSETFQ
ncbi:MAG: c-type cytochrome [Thioalkalivibrionaceae bacterium]